MSQVSITTPNVVSTAFRELMKGVYTSIPADVLAFDSNTQRAQIQIGVQRVDVSGGVFTPPPIMDVPVFFTGDQFGIEFQIDPGCEGAVYFSQRCIDGWKNTGGVAANPLGRFHSMQDAYFLPGIRSLPNVLPDFQNNGVRLRNKSGTQFAWLKNDGSIAVENGAGHIRMSADGIVTINGVTFDTLGNVNSPTEIQSETVKARTDVFFGPSSTSGIGHTHNSVQSGPNRTGDTT